MANEIVTTIIGNVVADPRLGSYQRRAVCNFTVATTARFYDSDSEEWQDGPTTFVQCAQWGNPAKNTNKSLAKGTRVIVHGSLFTDTWTDDNDNERLQVKMTVAEVGLSTQFTLVGKREAPAKKGPNKGTANKQRAVEPVPDVEEDPDEYDDNNE